VKLDAIDERVVVDGPGVGGAPTQGLAVRLSRSPHVRPGDRREGDDLDGVDLDLAEADAVAATLLDLWSLPQSDRERDVSCQNVIAQLVAELHNLDASCSAAHPDERLLAAVPAVNDR